jgi:hypothetical protein
MDGQSFTIVDWRQSQHSLVSSVPAANDRAFSENRPSKVSIPYMILDNGRPQNRNIQRLMARFGVNNSNIRSRFSFNVTPEILFDTSAIDSNRINGCVRLKNEGKRCETQFEWNGKYHKIKTGK